jgi:hypothetical protein
MKLQHCMELAVPLLFYKDLPLVSILGCMNHVHALPSYFCKIHFNIFLSLVCMSSNDRQDSFWYISYLELAETKRCFTAVAFQVNVHVTN